MSEVWEFYHVSWCSCLVGSCVGGALFLGNVLWLVLIDLGQILGLFSKINPTYQNPCIWNLWLVYSDCIHCFDYYISGFRSWCRLKLLHHEAQTPDVQSPRGICLWRLRFYLVFTLRVRLRVRSESSYVLWRRTKWKWQKECCINWYFAWDGRIRLWVLSRQRIKCTLNGITHSFIACFCVCRSRSCH